MLLENLIEIPNGLNDEVYKCRVIYSKEIESVEFEKYIPPKISSLKVVESNFIDYSFKFNDRTQLNDLFQRREDCDDILIVKNGFITDTSYANIVFWDGQNWLTPSTPILAGTARARLLHENKIKKAEVNVADLLRYEKARIINALNDLDDSQDIYNF